jgi:hypothetical protein
MPFDESTLENKSPRLAWQMLKLQQSTFNLLSQVFDEALYIRLV